MTLLIVYKGMPAMPTRPATTSATQGTSKTTTTPADGQRTVGIPLAISIALLPGIFAWFLLKKGYSTKARMFGFGWAALLLTFSMAVAIVDPPADPVATDAVAHAAAEADVPDGRPDKPSQGGGQRTADADDAVEPVRTAAPPALPEKQRKGFHCLSPWDGSHPGMKAAIRDRLRDPDSFEHDRTAILPIDTDGHHLVMMSYRARNGFGGMNLENAIGIIDNKTCDLLKLQM